MKRKFKVSLIETIRWDSAEVEAETEAHALGEYASCMRTSNLNAETDTQWSVKTLRETN